MKHSLFTLILIFFNLIAIGQERIIKDLAIEYDAGNYDKMIEEHASKAEDYPAKALYFIGMAYYMKSDDTNCIKFMDFSIEKDPTDPDTYFIKGMTYNFMSKFEEAVPQFDKAIELDDSNPHYFSGAGDSYYNLGKYKKALAAYTAATEKDVLLERPYVMIPQIYSVLEQPEEALAASYKATEALNQKFESYQNALYNIGLYELLSKNYHKAEAAYDELMDINPNDLSVYPKLIQVYYGKKEYEKAKPFREKLYRAYEAETLPENLQTMFCFDQFQFDNKHIYAFERFEEREGELYYKHVFYVTNEKEETECTIQTENSPFSVMMDGPKYAVGMDKGNSHSTFGLLKKTLSMKT